MTETPLPDISELTREDFIQCLWSELFGISTITNCGRVYNNFQKVSEAASDRSCPADAEQLVTDLLSKSKQEVDCDPTDDSNHQDPDSYC